jgi:hypothetical protein
MPENHPKKYVRVRLRRGINVFPVISPDGLLRKEETWSDNVKEVREKVVK